MARSAVSTVAVAAALATALGVEATGSTASSPAARRPAAKTLIAVGDIAACDSSGDEATARLVDRIPGTIATLGDNVYERGTVEEWARCYDPSWGRHKRRTRPSPGNHDYATADGAPYYAYFGRAAGPPGRGYYSYNLGAWHLISLNSETATQPGSPQEQWLRADLARHRRKCTLAYWHKPRFAAAPHALNWDVRGLWDALYAARADVVLAGHEHNYQRFAPLDRAGNLDRQRGMRQFVVGTGGRSHEHFHAPVPHTQRYNTDTYGVLRLTLRKDRYSWRFVPEAGKTFTDSGSAKCQ